MSENNSIESVADMIEALQKEIEDIKEGTLDESKARVIRGFRALQLKTAELNLQYRRLYKGRVPAGDLPLLPSGTTAPESAKQGPEVKPISAPPDRAA